MKALLALIFVVYSLSALACNPEAQFIGTVKELKVYDSYFTFKVQATRHYQVSGVCPLEEDQFNEAVLTYPGTPSIKNGDEISGVMVYDVASDSFKID